MGWFTLGLAIGSEIVGTVALRYSKGLHVLVPSLVVVIGYVASFYFLALALKTVPLSSAYAIWSAVGTAVVAVAGVLLFSERLNAIQIAGIVAVVGGVVAINVGART